MIPTPIELSEAIKNIEDTIQLFDCYVIDCGCFENNEETAPCKHEKAIKTALTTLQAFQNGELVDRYELTTLKSILGDSVKWMKWCDIKVLERCEGLEKQLSEKFMSRDEVEKIITDTAVAINTENIKPSFIWKCSIEELASALTRLPKDVTLSKT